MVKLYLGLPFNWLVLGPLRVAALLSLGSCVSNPFGFSNVRSDIFFGPILISKSIFKNSS